MKKGIIAVSLLLTGALLITPITTNASSAKSNLESVNVEQVINTENTEVKNELNSQAIQTEEVQKKVENTDKLDTSNKQPVKEEVKTEDTSNEPIKEEIEEVAVDTGMSKEEAEAILNKYIADVEQAEYTYTYQGDENTFEVIKEKGIRGYVFLPNIETDMAYLVDKDNGSIYHFHPSGYLEKLQ